VVGDCVAEITRSASGPIPAPRIEAPAAVATPRSAILWADAMV
jgi:hypothetical protein